MLINCFNSNFLYPICSLYLQYGYYFLTCLASLVKDVHFKEAVHNGINEVLKSVHDVIGHVTLTVELFFHFGYLRASWSRRTLIKGTYFRLYVYLCCISLSFIRHCDRILIDQKIAMLHILLLKSEGLMLIREP